MKKILRKTAWFLYAHGTLRGLLFGGPLIIGTVGLGIGIGNGNRLLLVMGTVCSLAFAFLLVADSKFSTNEENPEIAKAETQKILEDNPQLNPPINNHAELVKWLKSYQGLLWKKKELAKIMEGLKKLPAKKKEIEAEIKNLKSEIGIS